MVDDRLPSWDKVKGQFTEGSGILIGNGASQASSRRSIRRDQGYQNPSQGRNIYPREVRKHPTCAGGGSTIRYTCAGTKSLRRLSLDYFWGEGQEFDVTDTETSGTATKVLYLHGGLHLYRLPSGATIKRKAEAGLSLLDLFGVPFTEGAIPLFITEGTSQDKLASIHRSDYLSFAY